MSTRIYLSPVVGRTSNGRRLMLSDSERDRLRAAVAHKAYKAKRAWARGCITSALQALSEDGNPFAAECLVKLSAVRGFKR